MSSKQQPSNDELIKAAATKTIKDIHINPISVYHPKVNIN
jgi:hypothetical protein